MVQVCITREQELMTLAPITPAQGKTQALMAPVSMVRVLAPIPISMAPLETTVEVTMVLMAAQKLLHNNQLMLLILPLVAEIEVAILVVKREQLDLVVLMAVNLVLKAAKVLKVQMEVKVMAVRVVRQPLLLAQILRQIILRCH